MLPDRGHLVANRAGSIMISPASRGDPTSLERRHYRFLGFSGVVDDRDAPFRVRWKLIVRKPWPCIFGVSGGSKRFKEVYWSEVKGGYFTGDGCRCDGIVAFWIVGRIDDVLNVAGPPVGTAEVKARWSVIHRSQKRRWLDVPMTSRGRPWCWQPSSQPDRNRGVEEHLRNHIGKEIGRSPNPRSGLQDRRCRRLGRARS